MRTQLKTTIFLAMILVLTISGCSAPTPTEAPAVQAPQPSMAGGVYEEAGYHLFNWVEGLKVLVWLDTTRSSICSGGTTNTDMGTNLTECNSINSSDQSFDWQIETSDGLTGKLTFNGMTYDLFDGNVFTITTLGDQPAVEQFQRDLSGVTVERESIITFTNNDEDLSAFLKYAGWKNYANSDFGLAFRYPADWMGPDVYTVDQDLRIEVGSDVVYPYGTDRVDQVYTVKDSYYILVEYTKSGGDPTADEGYQSLLTMQDGESKSETRSKITRVRQLSLGSFEGFEYIATLSETAQTEIFYVRQVVLYGPNGSVLRITGQPNNVEMTDKTLWQDTYKAVDAANQALFEKVLDSISIQ